MEGGFIINKVYTYNMSVIYVCLGKQVSYFIVERDAQRVGS